MSLRPRKNIGSVKALPVFFADPATRLETNGDGELVPQRRERYVFRPILIKILEGFFTQSPFPDLNKRVEIATACNQVLQIEKRGVGLMPKEVVSPQVVANWFANKRKELRRRSQEASEHAATVAATSEEATVMSRIHKFCLQIAPTHLLVILDSLYVIRKRMFCSVKPVLRLFVRVDFRQFLAKY
ncbi:unnamed protein product [Heligmosomoides polygyrus]|uniref:Homeobox domain-containing protein n=1 Tax=Heligmosomoides polygyrus TaxID=6339 RepID=A0A3P8DVM2_HELPZ|nr:unnamed protein product [Heligmosomoides polygyrus]